MTHELMASTLIGFPILSLLIALPLMAAVIVGVFAKDTWAQPIALIFSLVQLALASVLAWVFRTDTSDMQFVERIGSYHLGIDGVSVFFIPLTALLACLTVLTSEASAKKGAIGGYLAAVLVFEAFMVGAFAAADTALFVLFFLLEVIPSWYLITRYGTGDQARQAAQHYVFAMLAAGLLIAAGLALFGNAAGPDGAFSTDMSELLANRLPADQQTLAFFILLLGLAIKAPLFPFHAWMPRVLEQGPVVGMSVFLVGIKLGTYGMMRFLVPLAPDAVVQWWWVPVCLGVVSMVYGALIALVQVDLRRLLAFASVSHMGVVMLGLFSLNFSGFQGALLLMMSLGMTGAGLYFLAGFLHSRIGHSLIVPGANLGQVLPGLALAFLVIGLAGVGMPGASGFNGEHLVIIGAYKMHWLMAVATGLGTVLGAAYFLSYYQRAFMSEGNQGAGSMPDLNAREKLIALSITAVIFWVGLYTTPFLRAMAPSLATIEKRVVMATPAPPLAEGTAPANPSSADPSSPGPSGAGPKEHP